MASFIENSFTHAAPSDLLRPSPGQIPLSGKPDFTKQKSNEASGMHGP
jgi:hypothetical protein